MTTYPINNNYKICRRCKLKKPIFEFTAERVTHFLLSGKKKYYYYRECNKCKKQRFKLLAGSKYKDRKNVYTKQIKGNEDILNAFLKKALTEKNNKLSMNLSNYELSGKATNNYKSVEDLISVIKSQTGNENFTDIEIIQSLINEGLLQVRG